MKTELTAADCVCARVCRADLQFLLALLPRNFGIFWPPERGGVETKQSHYCQAQSGKFK